MAMTVLGGSPLWALDIPHANKGADGALHPTEAKYVLDLSKAVTGRWDAPQSAPLEPGGWGVGIYDPEKWAVVFKFSSVTVPAGTTVTFKNHPSRAPVVWLVDGDVTIAGTVDLSGGRGDEDPNRIRLAEPGPGGFRGGDARLQGTSLFSGLGPGGGLGNLNGNTLRYASFGTAGANNVGQAPLYGNSRLIPLIGGSGVGPDENPPHVGGPGGGGAILIAARGRIGVARDGGVIANGGESPRYTMPSGGGIRIIAEHFENLGLIQALAYPGQATVGQGRIRIEARHATGLASQPFVFPVPPDNPVQLWPDEGAPTVRIVSVAESSTPLDPRAEVSLDLDGGARPADVSLPPKNVSNLVTIESFNLQTNALVELRVVSFPSGGDLRVPASLSSVDPVNPNRLIWTRVVEMPMGYHILQVRAEAP